MEQTSPPPPAGPAAKSGLAEKLGPLARQSWINLKAWAPFFRNPLERDRLAKYPFQDYRTGLKWRIVFPKQCWHCQQEGELNSHEMNEPVRAFEHALGVVAGVAAVWMLVALLCLFGMWLTAFIMIAFVTAIGGAVLMLKSWIEPATFVSWHCLNHREPPGPLELAVEDGKMFVLLPTPEMARAAEEEIAALRRRGRGSPSGGSPSAPQRPWREPSGPPDAPIRPYSPPPPIVQEELPPIRLAGEDE